MPSRFNLPHLDIAASKDAQPYAGPSSFSKGAVRERAEHGRRLQRELDAAFALSDAGRPIDARLPEPTGTFIEVTLTRGTKPDSLDAKSKGLRSSGAKIEANQDRSILLYVPDTARPALQKIIDDYLNAEVKEGESPPQKKKVEAIEAFRAARLERFWNDDPAALPAEPQDEIWWALWCFKGREHEAEAACVTLGARVAETDKWLHFPEVVVVPAFTSRATIELLLFATGAISELRRASDSPVFFTDDVHGEEQPWIEDLAERVVWPGTGAPAVCILDTGVNRGHALIEPALATTDLHAVDPAWGGDDDHAEGHGTSMAGLALHGDLTAALADMEGRRLTHRIESVKVLPPRGFPATEPRSYGPITQSAVARPEIEAPDRARVFCMAITNENVSGSVPSAWSAAVDQAAAGTMAGDDADAPRRLIILSAGNAPAETNAARLRPQDEYPIEDPAQAWNALTIGGYTDLIKVRERDYERWSPIAGVGELSPHSRTSVTWPTGAPFKPELVTEAGNRAMSPARTEVLTMGSLSLLTTGKDTARAPLVTFDATSAAAAQAARIAARIAADHPDYWPEMVRGLMVHSAEWTPAMLAAFQERPSKRDRYDLVRRFGYGVPDYERATASACNHLALFAQAEIQPFKLEGSRKFNECHYYPLPIPRAMLETLENETVELKVTLSYFIDPNPGLSANIDPQRYQSHGLRFHLRRKNEPVDRFKKRINASERENPRIGPRAAPDDDRWMLGEKSVSAGSLHCDVWRGPGIELIGRDMLCVCPVVGWCRQRSTPAVCNATRRYALIVSLKTSNTEIDLYTPISVAIAPQIEIEPGI